MSRRIVEFEVFNLDTGNTVAYTNHPEEAQTLALDYQANPALIFIGIDESGYQARTWTIAEVLAGVLEADLAVVQ